MNKNANDIGQHNDGTQGYAHAGSNPQKFDFRKKRPSNLGMTGPNDTRYTPLTVIAGLSSRLALPDNRWRNYLMIQNQSIADIYIGFGVHVGGSNENGFLISSGGFYELDTKPPSNSIYVRGTALSLAVLFIDGTIDRNLQQVAR